MYFGVGPNSNDLLYKMVLTIGLALLVTTFIVAHQKNRDYEAMAGLIAISITDTTLAISGLSEQLKLINKEIESRAAGHTSYERQKLEEETALLQGAIDAKQGVLDLLNQSRLETQTQSHFIYGIAAASITVSMVMIVYGFLGWHFHLKIFKDRRQQERS